MSVFRQQAGRFAAAVDEPEGELDELPLVPPAIPEFAAPLSVALPVVLAVPYELLPVEFAVLSCTLP